MRKALSLIFILLISLSFIAENVKAEQVEHLGFEGFTLTKTDINADGGQSVSASHVISLSSQKYLVGMYVSASFYNDAINLRSATLTVKVNGETVFTKTYSAIGGKAIDEAFTVNTAISDTYTIEIILSGSTADITDTDIHYDVAYFMNEDYGVKSKLTELKYIPPGADNTAQGLILNQTEVYLKQSYTLPEGSISFWLKWDGSTNVQISDDVGIDADGYIYIKNDDGTTYTLEGVSPPTGEYVPVYIGWRNGEGYIMMNTTKITLNWAGNVTISKVGSVSQSTSTIIDEFKLWNEYIPPDQIIYESQRDQYTLLYNNTAIAIKAESGLSLGTIDVAFLDANYNTINSTTLSAGSKTAEVPTNTSMIVLTRGSVSRTYLLDKNYSTIKFPAEEATIVVTKIQVTPEAWDIMEVKTVDGAVATREYLSNNIGGFTAVYGNQYLFVFERDNETVVRLTTIKGDTVFYILTTKEIVKPPVDFQVTYDVESEILSVIYFDQNMNTQGLNVTIEGYKDFVKVFDAKDNENTTFGYYKFTVSPTDTDYVHVILYALVNGTWEKYEKTVPTGGGNRSPFPPNLIPPAFVVLGAAIVPLFLSKGTEPWLMLIGGAIGLTFVALIGWIQMTKNIAMLITALTVLGVLAMLAYRR